MRKTCFFILIIASTGIAISSCKNDSYLSLPPQTPDQSFTEEFDTVAKAFTRDWKIINGSDPAGTGTWQQGGSITPWFAAFSSSGNSAGFIRADYTSTSAAQGIISNWLVSPAVIMQNGDKIIFYTRGLIYPVQNTTDSTDYGNRLQVLINKTGSLNIGKGLGAGDFSPVLDINPFYNEYHTLSNLYDAHAYPAKWIRFEATVFGLNKPGSGRFAFRYIVEEGGFNGRGSGVAIDKVQYQSVKP